MRAPSTHCCSPGPELSITAAEKPSDSFLRLERLAPSSDLLIWCELLEKNYVNAHPCMINFGDFADNIFNAISK